MPRRASRILEWKSRVGGTIMHKNHNTRGITEWRGIGETYVRGATVK